MRDEFSNLDAGRHFYGPMIPFPFRLVFLNAVAFLFYCLDRLV